MPVYETPETIQKSIDGLDYGLRRYRTVQALLPRDNNFYNRQFRRAFNGFYRVRRNQNWQDHYYGLFPDIRNGVLSFREALEALYQSTGRVEASFVSKAFSTFFPERPVLDSKVLKRLNRPLPPIYKGAEERIEAIAALYEAVGNDLSKFLKTDAGKDAIRRFDERFGDIGLNDIKKLDLILWNISND